MLLPPKGMKAVQRSNGTTLIYKDSGALAAAKQPEPTPPLTARLRRILDLPEARERQRQAVAIALETEASPTEARSILASLPTDAVAQFPHGGTLFPEAARKPDPDHVRLSAILRCAEAEGREKAALEFATGTNLPVDQAAALLARMPKASASRIPTIEERAMGEPEFGNEPVPRAAKTRGGEAWNSVIDKMNNGASK